MPVKVAPLYVAGACNCELPVSVHRTRQEFGGGGGPERILREGMGRYDGNLGSP